MPPTPPDLPAEPDQARRFGRARSARAAALHEDYVELIADLLATAGEARTTDIARRLGVSHPTANKCIARLKRDGLATALPYRGVFLTESGQAMADRVRARHRLVVALLRAVGVPAEDAELDAEGIEHHVSDATLAAFARFLAAPHLSRKAGEVAGRSPAGEGRPAPAPSPGARRAPTSPATRER